MLTKLPTSLITPSDSAAFIGRPLRLVPNSPPSNSSPSNERFSQVPLPNDQNAAKRDPFFSIWSEAGKAQRNALKGLPTKDAISENKTTGQGYEETVSNLKDRTARLGYPEKLILGIRGNDGEKIGIGPLTKSFVMKRYEQKYGVTIGSITTNSKGAEISSPMLEKVTGSLKAGKQAAVIVAGAYHGHSSTVILGLEPETNKLHAVSVDSVQVAATERRHTLALQPILDALDAELEYKPGAADVSQKDAASCVTISCVLARDILLEESDDFAVKFEKGQQAPIATLRTAQRDSYLENNNYDPEMIYNSKTNRTLGEHRAEHTVTIADQPENDYLKAKSIQYTDSILNWLESLPNKEIRDELSRQLLAEAYPNNAVNEVFEKSRNIGT